MVSGNTTSVGRVTRPIEPGSRQSIEESYPVTREQERLIRLWRLAESRRDLIAIVVLQSRIGRLAYSVLEGAASRG